MFNAFIRFGDGNTIISSDAGKLSSAFLDPSAQFWVDFCAPTDPEHALLRDLFGFHPLAVEDVIHEVQRPKLESYAMVGGRLKTDYFILVIHGPHIDPDPNACSRRPNSISSFRRGIWSLFTSSQCRPGDVQAS
jgi:hypothetical protein